MFQIGIQVLSNSVSCGFKMLHNEEFQETANFCHMFDRFFDCLNTRRLKEGREKRKPDLDPYRSATDSRLHVSTTFLFKVCCCIVASLYLYSGWKRTSWGTSETGKRVH